MKDQAVKLLEDRITLAVTRMRDLAAEREAMASEIDRMRKLAAKSGHDGTRTRAAREALRHALAELREE